MPWRLITQCGDKRATSAIPTPEEAGEPDKTPAEVLAIALGAFIESEHATGIPANLMPFSMRLEEAATVAGPASDLSLIYQVDGDGTPYGGAHLIPADPARLTLCGLTTNDRFWESVGLKGNVPLHRCEVCLSIDTGSS